MKQKLDYNLDWGEYFKLDELSPSGIVRIKTTQGKVILPTIVGTMQLKINGEPHCWRIELKDKPYYVHRIIWVMVYGYIDSDLVIDHLDGNPLNNKIKNLKLKNLKGNSMNKRKQSNNTSGVTGVSLTTNGQGNYYYNVTWSELNGECKSRSFSVTKLGEDLAKTSALTFREQQIQRLISEGADYTVRHGL